MEAGWAFSSPASNAFPKNAALVFLAGSKPPAVGLSGRANAPSATAVNAAEVKLRRIAASRNLRAQALARLVLATGEANQGKLAAAMQDYSAAAAFAPLRDEAVDGWVRSAVQAKDAIGALAAADMYPIPANSPFRRAIAMQAAQAAVETGKYTEVARWTQGLPDTVAVIWLRAQAASGLGQTRAAGELARALIFRHPAANEAQLAAPIWQAALTSYPDLAPDWSLYLSQAEGLAGQPKRAVLSWRQAIAIAPEAQHDMLRARLARALLAAGDREGAATEAGAIVTGPEAAQAMEMQVELQRARHDPAGLDQLLETMQQRFPASLWYARALHEAGDEALIDGDPDWTNQYFDRLSHDFPRSVYGPNAAWQAAWAAYRRNDTDTAARLEGFLVRYPQSNDAVDALYWRGIWAREHQDASLAQACFRTAAARFAGTYFGMQARQMIQGPAPRQRPPWLRQFAVDPATPKALPPPANLAPELQRADWLDSAGLFDLESIVLRAALAKLPRGAASLTLARRVAHVERERQQWHLGLAAMLRALPNYLDLKSWQLSRGDWLYLFPRPFAADVQAAARENDVSSSLLYGIMRQETGFDVGSISSAKARGLMQLELGTARGQWKKLPASWRRLAGEQLQPADLLNPSLSIALGAGEIGSLLQTFQEPALALAGYNAGANRVRTWQAQQGKLAVNEFIESIPFSQTRFYVQGVLRNEMHYRQLYGSGTVAQ